MNQPPFPTEQQFTLPINNGKIVKPPLLFAETGNINQKIKEKFPSTTAQSNPPVPRLPLSKDVDIKIDKLSKEVNMVKEHVYLKMMKTIGNHEGLIDFMMKKIHNLEDDLNSMKSIKTYEELRKKKEESKPKKVSKKGDSDTEEN